jgi:hypothetical protein
MILKRFSKQIGLLATRSGSTELGEGDCGKIISKYNIGPTELYEFLIP